MPDMGVVSETPLLGIATLDPTYLLTGNAGKLAQAQALAWAVGREAELQIMWNLLNP